MTDGTVVVAVLGVLAAAISGFIAWLLGRRRNSGNIETSDATALWTESAQMRADLRAEVVGLRVALTESGVKLDAAVTQIGTLLDKVEASQAATSAAREETRISRAETAALRADVHAVHEEVKTGNALTIGALADNAESRRIGLLPAGERTDAENEHVDTVGIQGQVKPGEGSGDDGE